MARGSCSQRRAFLLVSLAACQASLPFCASASSGKLEGKWTVASGPFDNPAASPSLLDLHGPQLGMLKLSPSPRATAGRPPVIPDIWGTGGLPRGGSPPTGIGPVSRERSPGYGSGLLGGLLGLIMAPVAFAIETAQAVALTPVRMARGLINGDWRAILEPFRTAKNIVQDAALTGLGMLNSLSAPVWNAFRPDQATDFQYSNNRMIFAGGPIGGILSGSQYSGFAPSWHTIFVDREIMNDGSELHHEYVHNRQWQRSLLFEDIGEDYRGYKDWNDADAEDYLNW